MSEKIRRLNNDALNQLKREITEKLIVDDILGAVESIQALIFASNGDKGFVYSKDVGRVAGELQKYYNSAQIIKKRRAAGQK